MTGKIVSWFSAGVTSAVASKLALETGKDIELVYIETGSHHKDNERFLEQCEEWYGQKIVNIKNPNYRDVFDVVKRNRYVNGPSGAKCTTELKRKVRKRYEYGKEIKSYVWGFHYGRREKKRAERVKEAMPYVDHWFPLIDNKITKENALCILEKAGIERPLMYRLGYNNNNCIGCVKGGRGYWNKIRQDFPEAFNQMALLERDIGRSCIRGRFLDELGVDEGREIKEIIPECGIQCELNI